MVERVKSYMNCSLHTFRVAERSSFRKRVSLNLIVVWLNLDILHLLFRKESRYVSKNGDSFLIKKIKFIHNFSNKLLLSILNLSNEGKGLKYLVFKRKDGLNKISFHLRTHLPISIQIILFLIYFLLYCRFTQISCEL